MLRRSHWTISSSSIRPTIATAARSRCSASGSTRNTKTFSSEVETGSRQENASNQESGAPFRFNRNGGLACWFHPPSTSEMKSSLPSLFRNPLRLSRSPSAINSSQIPPINIRIGDRSRSSKGRSRSGFETRRHA
ncbi:MAG: hypothetical protein E8A46_13500 [Bradyrhizobium sp.]|nr:MAG: hypothetical protein E8A46_13500 [Bradyrhizobium sp.]